MKEVPARWRRPAADLVLLVAIGIFLALISPYASGVLAFLPRLIYWIGCIVGGGVIGFTCERLIGLRMPPGWRRLFVAAVTMTPPVALLVFATGAAMGIQRFNVASAANLLWQVFVISLPVLAVRSLVWRAPVTIVETRTIVKTPVPMEEVAFRQRLSSRRRTARLIAVEADDHYVRVHTNDGTELVTLRFADALAELTGAEGMQIHRSWWVANDAIEAVRWRRGGAGEATLFGNFHAPVSRNHAPTLKAAGWF